MPPPVGGPSFTEPLKMTCTIPSRVSTCLRLKSANDLRTGEGCTKHSDFFYVPQLAPCRICVRRPGFKYLDLQQARTGALQSLLKLPNRTTTPSLYPVYPQLAQHCSYFNFVCCGREKESLLLSTWSLSTHLSSHQNFSSGSPSSCLHPHPQAPALWCAESPPGELSKLPQVPSVRSFATNLTQPHSGSSRGPPPPRPRPGLSHLQAFVLVTRRWGAACALGAGECAWLPVGCSRMSPLPSLGRATSWRVTENLCPGQPTCPWQRDCQDWCGPRLLIPQTSS